MSQKEARQIYQGLLDEGSLLDMFPDSTGDWKKDKSRFMDLYNKNMEAISGDLLDLDEDTYFEEDFNF